LQNLVAERIDMGVDYSGTGPVYAIGPGVVTEVDQSWAGGQGTGPGTFIAYRITQGPLSGRYVYTAENIAANVQPGQQVNESTPIGYASGGIETGFAAGPSSQGTTLAAYYGQQSQSGDPGAVSTGYGIAFDRVMTTLGAPAGVHQAQSGEQPSWIDRALQGILPIIDPFAKGGVLSGVHLPGSGIISSLSETGHWLGVFVSSITDVHMWISMGWLILGAILLFAGIYLLIRTSKAYQAANQQVTDIIAAAAK
jgi:hypothetical protein